MVAAVSLGSCCKNDDHQPDDTTGTPCLDSKVSQFKQDDNLCNTGATVKKYLFQNQFVYVFDLGPCGADFFSEVIDDQCNFLGNLGGIAGNTTINGASFSSAQYISTVWSN